MRCSCISKTFAHIKQDLQYLSWQEPCTLGHLTQPFYMCLWILAWQWATEKGIPVGNTALSTEIKEPLELSVWINVNQCFWTGQYVQVTTAKRGQEAQIYMSSSCPLAPAHRAGECICVGLLFFFWRTAKKTLIKLCKTWDRNKKDCIFNEENTQFRLQAEDTLDCAFNKKHFLTSDVFLVVLHSLDEKSDILALHLKVLSSLSPGSACRAAGGIALTQVPKFLC